VTVELIKGRPKLVATVVLTGLSSVALFRYVTKDFDKWEKLGIAYEKGHFPFGSFNLFSQSPHMYDHVLAMHKRHRSKPYCGWFMMRQPVLNINDPELLRHILVKDFNSFVERSSYDSDTFLEGGKYDKIWGRQLTSLKGDEWKQVRGTFSPIFTSGKMKGMLGFIRITADHLVKEFDKYSEGTEEVDCKKLFGSFTMDSLASAAFGIDVNSFNEENSNFTQCAAALFQMSVVDTVLIMFKIIVPGLSKLFETFNINIWKKRETKFFYDVILATIKARREGRQERRNDLVDLMMDSMKHDFVEEKEEEQFERDMKLKVDIKKAVDEDTLVATAMLFMIAGYDTTATTLSFASYILSKHPEEQQRLQGEIDQAFADADGDFPDYSAIQSLPYLDMVVHETLRMHPPIPFLSREAGVDYKIPGTDVQLRKGDLVSYVASGLHTDPAHYSHPDQFHPEHFSKEEKAGRSPYAFQAFGQGPRACIGMRFALLEAKVALVAVCRKFTLSPGTKTQEPLKQDPVVGVNWPKGGLWVKAAKR